MIDGDSTPHKIVRICEERPILAGALILLALTLLVFGDVLLAGNSRLLAQVNGDMGTGEAYWRQVAFPLLRRGRVMLWNPYLFSGAPFYAESQTALLYPPNWLHLFLPLAMAINLIIAIHVFLTGFWMFLWAHRRGLTFVSSLFCGILLMFSGPFFMHVVPGHMNNLAAMSWVPLLLMAADMLLERRYAMGMLLGVIGLAMQIFAAQPQYTYYTLIALALYMLVNLIKGQSAQVRLRCVLAMIAIGIGALAITAVELLPVLKQAAESSRGTISGVSTPFASRLSLPPENLLTLVAPSYFGNITNVTYWGRWYIWEMSLFFSVTGVVLAAYGAATRTVRGRWPLILVALVFLVLALGKNTPLFYILYSYFPGFNRFRGTSKFGYFAILFAVMLAGNGLDALMADGAKTRKAAIVAAAGAAISIVLAVVVNASANDGLRGDFGSFFTSVQMAGEGYLTTQIATDPAYLHRAAELAAASLLGAAAALTINAVLLGLRPKTRMTAYLLAIFAVIEIVTFAASNRPSFPTKQLYNPALQTFLDRNLGEGRVLIEGDNPNIAFVMGTPSIWGYDSFNLNRYAEFIALANGADPDNFDQKSTPKFRPSPLYAMLRLKFVLSVGADGTRIGVFRGPYPTLPHVALLQRYIVLPNRNAEFALMSSRQFNPNTVAILESHPKPITASPAAAGAGPAGTIGIVRDDGDSMEIEGDVLRPAILLITDSYAAGWRAVALPGSSQSRYQVMPADYTLRGIPIGPGHQHLRVEFVPIGLPAGEAITTMGLIAYVAALTWFITARRRDPAGPTPSLTQAGEA